jgi:hypothetical protein
MASPDDVLAAGSAAIMGEEDEEGRRVGKPERL